MRRTVDFAAVFTLTAMLALTGCTDPTLPADHSAESFFSRPPAPGFDATRRSVALPAPLSTSRAIGPDGGEIRIAAAGVTFVVPAGALDQVTDITVTALAGDALAFEFAPHGLEFARPASIRVDVAGTEAEHLLESGDRTVRRPLDRFLGVYFTGDEVSGYEALENLGTYLLDGSIVFEIEHFSGYVCASG